MKERCRSNAHVVGGLCNVGESRRSSHCLLGGFRIRRRNWEVCRRSVGRCHVMCSDREMFTGSKKRFRKVSEQQPPFALGPCLHFFVVSTLKKRTTDWAFLNPFSPP
jgi:hypothetical protein